MISREENLELVRRVQAGDQEAENELVRKNEGLITRFVKRWAKMDREAFQDLMNIGRLEVVRAAKYYDLKKYGKKSFTTLAVTFMQKAWRTWWCSTRDKRMRWDKCFAGYRHTVKAHKDSEYVDQDEYWTEIRKLWEVMEKGLTGRERKIIQMRYGFGQEPMTLAAVGKKIGITRERTRQLEAKAIRKLKVHFDDA